MPDDWNAEWLAVVERQQQEIELLRQQLPALSPLRGASERRGSDASSVASLALSALSMRDDAQLPMDSARYAQICDKMEQLRAALARKDARLRKARAQGGEAQKVVASLRDTVEQLRSQVEAQRAQLAREQVASQGAVNESVEKAAQALLKNGVLAAELSKLREADAVLREEVKKAEAVRNELQLARRETTRLAADLREMQNERSVLQRSLQSAQQELVTKRTCDAEWEEKHLQQCLLQQRVNELQTFAQQQSAQLRQQTTAMIRQKQQIQQLRQEQILVQQRFAAEHAEDQSHAAHLLKENLVLQNELECEQTRSCLLHEQAREESETGQLLAEELLQTKFTVADRDRELRQRGDKYSELVNAYRALGRHAQSLESSERELVSVLIPTKKRLALLQDTLTRFCYELEAVSKRMVTSRNREVSLGRALREYGKRNRDLQASVVAARQQLLHVVSAFRSSERRKEQAISANWNLKRDLVVQRCQRTDLVEQCKELENCLDSCQSSASDTQARAEGLEQDNGVLQHAVTQLVAYARELMSSQQSLQRELTKLEITGRRQPAVYG